MNYSTWIDFATRIGPLLSGVGAILTAVAAWLTVVIVSRRTLHMQWLSGSRQLYDEFWKDPVNAEVRKWIANDIEYKEIEQVLKRRLKTELNILEQKDNAILDKIDQFCALLTKIQFFEQKSMTNYQRQMAKFVYGNYWLPRIEGRQALARYILKYWPSISFH